LSFDLCPECGVPLLITAGCLWRSDGTLVVSTDTTWRSAFVDSENLSPVYARINQVIGIPIDHLIMDIFRKGTVEFISHIMPREVMEAAKSGLLDMRAFAETIAVNSYLFGLGANELMDLNPDEYLVGRVTEPFCIQQVAGMLAGSCEAMTGGLVEATYREVLPDVYELTARFTEEHDEGLEGRLQPRRYSQREGDIELERCVSCGSPKALSRFSWNLTLGKINDAVTSRRMVLIGPELQDLLFEEFEAELGDTIPRVVVEAQKEFVKNGSYSIEEISDQDDFRTQLALKGMGNLRRLHVVKKGLRMRLDNASNYLMTIGMIQGLFEMAFGGESFVDWEISENGDLEVEVLPRSLKQFVAKGS
jgi:hypothetical protein